MEAERTVQAGGGGGASLRRQKTIFTGRGATEGLNGDALAIGERCFLQCGGWAGGRECRQTPAGTQRDDSLTWMEGHN